MALLLLAIHIWMCVCRKKKPATYHESWMWKCSEQWSVQSQILYKQNDDDDLNLLLLHFCCDFVCRGVGAPKNPRLLLNYVVFPSFVHLCIWTKHRYRIYVKTRGSNMITQKISHRCRRFSQNDVRISLRACFPIRKLKYE